MVVRELFVKLGLEKDSASFAEGFATVEALKAGLEKVAELAHEAVRFLSEQIDKTVEAGVEADRFAQKMGLTTKEVQELAYVGKTAGVTLNDMQVAMRTLALRGVTDLRGTIFSLADQFSKMKDGGYKLGLATEYLGRAGSRLIPILNKGRDAVKELMQEAEDLGYVMDQQQIQTALREYDETTVRLHASLEGLRNAVIVPLLPYITKAAEVITKVVVATAKWIKNAGDIGTHLKALGTAMTLLLIPMAPLLSALAEMAWAALVAAAPFLAWAAAIAAVYLALDDLLIFLQNGKSVIGDILTKWVGPFGTWQEGVEKAKDKVKGYFEELWEWLESTAVPKLEQIAVRLADAVENSIRANHPILAGIFDAIPAASQFLGDKATAGAGWLSSHGLMAPDDGGWPGGAAGPAASFAYSNATPGQMLTQNITVNAPNADAKEVAQKVLDTSAEQAKAARRKAAHGARP